MRALSEFLPLLIFFITFKLSSLINATIAMTVTSVLTIGILYFLNKKVPLVSLFSLIVLIFISLLTIYSGDSTFIKLKPTIINFALASVLYIGTLRGKGLIKYLLNNTFELTDENWIKASKRWAIFFLFLSVLNEVVWRNLPEETWVKFKVFAIIPLSLIFTISQIPFFMKNNLKNEHKA